MDTVGNRKAHTEIQAIKISVPSAVSQIIDLAVQVHGAAGVSQRFPLAELYAPHRRRLRRSPQGAPRPS